MKKIYSSIIYPIILCLIVDGAEYVEAPFQKYGVMLTQKKLGSFSNEMFPMVMFGEKFLCDIPSEEEAFLARNAIYPDISVLKERINAMPCIPWRQSQWTYVVCPHIIYRIHNRNFTRIVLGQRYNDSYIDKNLEGFFGKGEQTFYTRHFTGDRICGASSEDVQTIVWYFCRQSKEEGVFSLQQISSCEFEIRIFTPRVCSGFNFESTTGHQIHCYAEKDAKALVVANEDRIESPRYGLSFLDSPRGLRGDVYFVINANIRLDGESARDKGTTEEINEKKFIYRADEIMSASVGEPFNFSVDPQNAHENGEFTWNAVSLLYADIIYKREVFHNIVEKLKKIVHSLKKNKKKET